MTQEINKLKVENDKLKVENEDLQARVLELERDRGRSLGRTQSVMIVMLLWAIYPGNPDMYFLVLKWVCCIGFFRLFFKWADLTTKFEHRGWMIVFYFVGGVYSMPIWNFGFERLTWISIDLITVGLLGFSIWTFREKYAEIDLYRASH